MRNIFITTILIMCYLKMQAQVIIRDEKREIIIPNIKSYRIEQDVKQLSDKATVIFGRNYNEFSIGSILQYIKSGMSIEIKSGYNDDLQTEFKGFIKPGISTEFPMVLECDELQNLRQRNIVHEWSEVTLRNLLEYVVPNFTIECPNANLGKMQINNASPLHVLNDLKKRYGFFSRIDDNVLSVGWAYDFNPSFTKNHVYEIGKNCKSGRGLKYRTETDFDIKCKAVLIIAGRRQSIFEGSDAQDATVVSIPVNERMSVADVRKILQAQYQKRIYDGYVGEVVGFGFPRTRAGDSITILNDKYQDRDGTYLIEKVVVEFDESHIERTNTLSFKVA